MRVATWRNCNKLHLLRPWYPCPWVCRGKPSMTTEFWMVLGCRFHPWNLWQPIWLILNMLLMTACSQHFPTEIMFCTCFDTAPLELPVLTKIYVTPIWCQGHLMMSQLLFMRLADPTHWLTARVCAWSGPWHLKEVLQWFDGLSNLRTSLCTSCPDDPWW